MYIIITSFTPIVSDGIFCQRGASLLINLASDISYFKCFPNRLLTIIDVGLAPRDKRK